jgi:hypothetical protein
MVEILETAARRLFQPYPWRVFAAVLAGILLLDVMFRKNRGTAGDADIGGWGWRRGTVGINAE